MNIKVLLFDAGIFCNSPFAPGRIDAPFTAARAPFILLPVPYEADNGNCEKHRDNKHDYDGNDILNDPVNHKRYPKAIIRNSPVKHNVVFYQSIG